MPQITPPKVAKVSALSLSFDLIVFVEIPILVGYAVCTNTLKFELSIKTKSYTQANLFCVWEFPMHVVIFKRSGHTRALLHFTKVAAAAAAAASILTFLNIHPQILSFFLIFLSFFPHI